MKRIANKTLIKRKQTRTKRRKLTEAETVQAITGKFASKSAAVAAVYTLKREGNINQKQYTRIRHQLVIHYANLAQEKEAAKITEMPLLKRTVARVKNAVTPRTKAFDPRSIVERVTIRRTKEEGRALGTISPEFNRQILQKDPLYEALQEAVRKLEKEKSIGIADPEFEVTVKKIENAIERIRVRRMPLNNYIFWLGQMKKHRFMASYNPKRITKMITNILIQNGNNPYIKKSISTAVKEKLITKTESDQVKRIITQRLQNKTREIPKLLEQRSGVDVGDYRRLQTQLSQYNKITSEEFGKAFKRLGAHDPITYKGKTSAESAKNFKALFDRSNDLATERTRKRLGIEKIRVTEIQKAANRTPIPKAMRERLRELNISNKKTTEAIARAFGKITGLIKNNTFKINQAEMIIAIESQRLEITESKKIHDFFFYFSPGHYEFRLMPDIAKYASKSLSKKINIQAELNRNSRKTALVKKQQTHSAKLKKRSKELKAKYPNR